MPKGRTEIVCIYLGKRNIPYDPFEISELREWVKAKASLCSHSPDGYGISDAYRIEREPVMLWPDGYTVDLYGETRRVVCPNCGKRRPSCFRLTIHPLHGTRKHGLIMVRSKYAYQ